MKSTKNNIFKFTIKDTIKANKIASREISLENSTGWSSTHKIHKSIKSYSRKPKHKKTYSIE